jgi:hypothetical protein
MFFMYFHCVTCFVFLVVSTWIHICLYSSTYISDLHTFTYINHDILLHTYIELFIWPHPPSPFCWYRILSDISLEIELAVSECVFSDFGSRISGRFFVGIADRVSQTGTQRFWLEWKVLCVHVFGWASPLSHTQISLSLRNVKFFILLLIYTFIQRIKKYTLSLRPVEERPSFQLLIYVFN